MDNRGNTYHSKEAEGVAAASVTQGEISRLLEELNIITMNLQGNVDALSDRLSLIKRNESTSIDAAEPSYEGYDATTDLGQFLATLIKRAIQTNLCVLETNNKLEL